MSGQGVIATPRTSDMILKKLFQNPVNLEHDQKVWAKSAGTKAHLLQALLLPGKIFASLALLKCILCSTLNCIKLRWAQDEELFTCNLALFHQGSWSWTPSSFSHPCFAVYCGEGLAWRLPVYSFDIIFVQASGLSRILGKSAGKHGNVLQ